MNRIKRYCSLRGILALCLLFPFFAIYGDAAIKGKVIDSSSITPLQNVRIKLIEAYSDRVIRETMTDIKGGYEFPQVTSGIYQVRAELEGYVAASLNPIDVNAENQIVRANFSMGIPGDIDGQVVDNFTGLPISNANVDLMRGNNIIASVLTDEEGYYRINGLAPRPYILRVRMVDFQSTMQLAVPVSNEVISVDFSLKFPPGHLRGQVIDLLSQEPISNAIIDFFENGMIIDSVQTDEEGRYFFSEIPPGHYQIRIKGNLYSLLLENIVFTAYQNLSLDFALEPEGLIEGRIVHKFTGQPIVGAAVGIWQNGELVGSTSTDEDGWYSLSGLKDTVIVIQSKGFYDERQLVSIRSAEVSTLDVNMVCLEPTPPRAANVITVFKRFAHQINRLNYVKWIRSTDPTVIAYHIYCDRKKVGVVSAEDSFVFKHRWTKGKEKKYQVIAVNAYGQESLPVDAVYIENK